MPESDEIFAFVIALFHMLTDGGDGGDSDASAGGRYDTSCHNCGNDPEDETGTCSRCGQWYCGDCRDHELECCITCAEID